MSIFNKLNKLCQPIEGEDPKDFGRGGYPGAWHDTHNIIDANDPEQPAALDMTDLNMVNGDYK